MLNKNQTTNLCSSLIQQYSSIVFLYSSRQFFCNTKCVIYQDVLYIHSSSSLRMATAEEYIFSSTFFSCSIFFCFLKNKLKISSIVIVFGQITSSLSTIKNWTSEQIFSILSQIFGSIFCVNTFF